MYYTYYIILCIDTGRIISGHNTAAVVAAAAAGGGGGARGEDAAHTSQSAARLLFRHFLVWCTAHRLHIHGGNLS